MLQDFFSFKIWIYENSSAWSMRTEVGNRQLSVDTSAKTCYCRKACRNSSKEQKTPQSISLKVRLDRALSNLI